METIFKIRDFTLKFLLTGWGVIFLITIYQIDNLLEMIGIDEFSADLFKLIISISIIAFYILMYKLIGLEYQDKIRVFTPSFNSAGFRITLKENLPLLIPLNIFGIIIIITTIIGEKSLFPLFFISLVILIILAFIIGLKGLSKINENEIYRIILTKSKIIIYTNREKTELAYGELSYKVKDDNYLELINNDRNEIENNKRKKSYFNIENLKKSDKKELLVSLSKLVK